MTGKQSRVRWNINGELYEILVARALVSDRIQVIGVHVHFVSHFCSVEVYIGEAKGAIIQCTAAQ